MPAENGGRLRVHEHLGAHFTSEGGVPGVRFAVWAPNARAVSVVGSFNAWDAREHPMRLRKPLGVWERFVPGLEPGEVYKYQIVTRQQGANLLKADPVGFFMEEPPRTASIVVAEDPFPWRDGEWMERRDRHQALDRPIAIYEVHAGSWLRGRDGFLSWRELAARLIPYAADLGYTHLQLLPVTEHPFYGSWGYQTVGYFAPTSRFGTPDDFRAFVDAAHRAGLGVILDWVPAHFPKDAHGLGFFDGTHLYEHADPRQGHHPDWATYIFNFGRRAVVEFLLSSALYWLESFHVDGLRVDAVASMLYLDYSRKDGEWVPNKFGGRENLEAIAFLRRLNRVVHERTPGVLMVAEESTAWPGVSRPVHVGGLGFDLKWNMGWMHDMLEYMRLDPVFRRFHQSKLTFSLHYAYSENFLLPLSHDEVVHGKQALVTKMPGDVWRRFANLRLLYGAMYGHPGKKLLFMGGEFGQWREWHHDRSLDWHLFDDPETGPFHHGLQDWVRDLNRLYRSEPALHEVDFHWHGFQWIDFRDVDQSVISYVRRAKDPDDFLVVVVNFTPVPRPGYRIGVPQAAAYREVLNGDAREYGGSGVVHPDAIVPEPGTRHGHEQWIELTLPPLAAVFLKPVHESKD